MTNAITETIGVDLGDRYSAYCVLDQGTGEIEEECRTRPVHWVSRACERR